MRLTLPTAVHAGEYCGQKVAVKIIKCDVTAQAFLQETTVMTWVRLSWRFDPHKKAPFLRMWRWLDFVPLPGSSSIRTWCDYWGSFLTRAFILLRSSWQRYKNTYLYCFSGNEINENNSAVFSLYNENNSCLLIGLIGNYCHISDTQSIILFY